MRGLQGRRVVLTGATGGLGTAIARRLVEAGVPFVRVGRAWWDSHGQDFETHQEMVPALDHVMATLIDDLAAGAGLAVRELHRTTMADVPAALVGVLPADVTSGDRHAQWHLHLLELGRTA